ncbi:hypothetical protein BGZ92_007708 [Podila epicladia]|nr:hypothetical protein BGZ92_007708 [Podila epicladia]
MRCMCPSQIHNITTAKWRQLRAEKNGGQATEEDGEEEIAEDGEEEFEEDGEEATEGDGEEATEGDGEEVIETEVAAAAMVDRTKLMSARQGRFSDEQKVQISKAARPVTTQVSSEGTDDIIVAASASDTLRDFARQVLVRKDFSFRKNHRQIYQFVNSCLLNLSNHHSVDTSGLLPALASPSGSSLLKEILLTPMCVKDDFSQSRLSFQSVVLPLIGVLTRESVCQSTMGNESNTIYGTVYTHHRTFVGGGIILCMQEVLSHGSFAGSSLNIGHNQCEVTSLSSALLAIVRLVYQIITRIRDARVTLADTITILASQAQMCVKISSSTDRDRFINEILVKETERLQRIVSDAKDSVIPFLDVTAADPSAPPTTGPNITHLRDIYDPPGDLSTKGPRHDNDLVNISEIDILPTQQEITCSRPPFLPSNGVQDAPHFLAHGWKRQVDTHFRLYREDMMDPLRRSMVAFLSALQHTRFGEEHRLLKHKELRKVIDGDVSLNVYGNVRVFGMTMERNTVGHIGIGFSQPLQILGTASKERRTEFWERSKNRLMHGGLVFLISRDQAALGSSRDASTPNFQLILAVIVRRDTEFLARDDKMARISITLADPLQYINMLNSASQSSSKHWFLVESPGSYFGSYSSVLKALQHSMPAVLPFGKYLAPTIEEQAQIRNREHIVDPPIYARAPEFQYDISVLLNGQECRLDVNNPDSIEQTTRTLKSNSTLDETQATALVDTLCREVALINGPPGTGKTWIGVALMQVLLANKAQSDCGPILCICYTNHALDQFLEHLLDKGINDIVRIGARSKSERLQQYNLHELMLKHDKPFNVQNALRAAYGALEADAKVIEDLERALQGDCLTWENVKGHLRLHFHDLYLQFDRSGNTTFSTFDLAGNQDEGENSNDGDGGFMKVESKRSKNLHHFDRWRFGHDIREITQRNTQVRESQRRSKKNNAHRFKRNLFAVLDSDVEKDWGLQAPVYKKIPSTDRPVHLLLGSDIWNMSMTERQRLLHQWRPHVQQILMIRLGKLVKDFDVLNNNKNDAFDEFRRQILRNCLVVGMTTNGAAKAQDLIQKLAPKIIICEEAGEVLESHILASLSSSTQHLILIGDHKQLRPQIETYHLFEVEMAKALASYLIKNGYDQPGDIAVLTPYLGQLSKLRDALKSSFMLIIDERDQEQLDQKELEEEAKMSQDAHPQTGVRNLSLQNHLTLRTIDNYQGEEAKIVIISLVRNNTANDPTASGKIGFLKSPNRTNVLLSRAQHGMFIIGNAELMEQEKNGIWPSVIDELRAHGRIESWLLMVAAFLIVTKACPVVTSVVFSVTRTTESIALSSVSRYAIDFIPSVNIYAQSSVASRVAIAWRSWHQLCLNAATSSISPDVTRKRVRLQSNAQ